MTKEEIGHVIRESRLSVGLTQLQVAEALGRPQQTIANWELGRSQPDANTLFALFKVLGRSVDEAFGFSADSFTLTCNEREMIKKYRTLDWYGKETIDLAINRECERQNKVYEWLFTNCYGFYSELKILIGSSIDVPEDVLIRPDVIDKLLEEYAAFLENLVKTSKDKAAEFLEKLDALEKKYHIPFSNMNLVPEHDEVRKYID